MVSRAVSVSLAGTPTPSWTPTLRRNLFDTFGTWCEEGSVPSRYRNEVGKAVAVSRTRIKDPESARQYETDMAETADMVEQAAYLAMAAMLLVRSFHDMATNSPSVTNRKLVSVRCQMFGNERFADILSETNRRQNI